MISYCPRDILKWKEHAMSDRLKRCLNLDHVEESKTQVFRPTFDPFNFHPVGNMVL